MTTEAPVFQSDLDEILDGVAPILKDFSGSRILVTGGTGFFGKWIMQSLLAMNRRLRDESLAGMRITLVTRSANVVAGQPWLRDSEVEISEVDLSSGMRGLGTQFDFVIHAASPTTAERTSGHATKTYNAIVKGTQNLLVMLKDSPRCRLLYISSGAVYGSQDSRERAAETDPLPDSGTEFGENIALAYAEGKRVGEELVKNFAKETSAQVSVARCFSFLGPYLATDRGYAAGNFVGDIVAAKTLRIQGDGSAVRSYLYPTDLVVWLLHILVRSTGSEAVYNVGSERGVSILELAHVFDGLREEFKRGCELNPRVEVQGHATTAFSANRYLPSVQKVKHKFSVREMVGLNEAARRSLQWHLRAP